MTLKNNIPLAAKLRPDALDAYFGQQHLLATGKPIRQALEQGSLHSMILWGPPGSGKTTLAHLLAAKANAEIAAMSAVFAGVKDIRAAVAMAQQRLQEGVATVLFIDEIHRFNKAQQDALLPFVEDGTLTLIGATTENPSFEVNSALLSRARVYVLKRLTQEDLLQIIQHALSDSNNGYGEMKVDFPLELQQHLTQIADGDARRCLNLLELAIELAAAQGEPLQITESILETLLAGNHRVFDKGGEQFYDQISALHKAVRGSCPDAALYWLSRMIDGGCDPLYIARRVVRMASEDIGNADPRGLRIALDAWETYERLGSPEGELAIAQAVAYLAVAPKSNAVYTAFKAAMQDAKANGSLPVPLHIRNAPTKLMKQLGHGKNYRYAHDEKAHYAAGEKYFPDEMPIKRYYQPADQGLEIKIKQKLTRLREMDEL